MRLQVSRSSAVVQTGRVLQLSGIFDLPASERSSEAWDVTLPLEDRPWNVGLIVGPSGSGKSTLAREAFGDRLIAGFDWPHDRAVVDGFREALPIGEITGALSAVGFSSPPLWLRPFHVLSNGQQFRATVARAIAEADGLFAIDEFTSVVDRTVAQVGSAAVAKAVRRAGRQFVAVTCHYDVIDWLDPDWILDLGTSAADPFAWRSLRGRPSLDIQIRVAPPSLWGLFKKYHYLSASLAKGAHCFGAFLDGRPVGFCAILPQPHPKGYFWRLHRSVVLPDYQGIAIGVQMRAAIAAIYRLKGPGARVTSNTANPALIHYARHSPLWRVIREPAMNGRAKKRGEDGSLTLGRSLGSGAIAVDRATATLEYVGPSDPEGFAALEAHNRLWRAL